MTPKLFKAAEVCDMAQVQPYVLRSWEKEFPGIGVEKSPDGPRLYRQSDIDQVLTIKQLVFGEGLTLAGARRRLEGSTGATGAHVVTPARAVAAVPVAAPAVADGVAASAAQPALFEATADSASSGETRERIAHVRDGLRSLLTLLSPKDDEYAHAAAASSSEPRAVRPRKRATA
jgi:DNA-binding transcriptional MerR regulator